MGSPGIVIIFPVSATTKPAPAEILTFLTVTSNPLGAEIELLKAQCASLGVNAILSDVWAKGGDGAVELAHEVVRLCDEEKGDFTRL